MFGSEAPPIRRYCQARTNHLTVRYSVVCRLNQLYSALMWVVGLMLLMERCYPSVIHPMWLNRVTDSLRLVAMVVCQSFRRLAWPRTV